MKSIQNRLTSGLSISLIAILILQWVIIGSSIRQLAEDYIITRLQHDSDSLLAAITINATDISLNDQGMGAIYQQPLSGHYYKAVIGETSFRSRSLWDTELVHTTMSVGQHSISHAIGPQQQRLLVLHGAYRKQNKIVALSVGEDLTPILSDITQFQITHAVVSALALALLVLLQRHIIRRGMRPLQSASQQIQQLEQGVIQQLDDTVPAEILPLIRELNHQLTAFKRRLERSRTASGNLAHALKTPLALIVQLSEHEKLESNPELKQRLQQYTRDIQQSIERELRRARLAGSYRTGQQISVNKEIADLIRTLAKMYQEKNIDVDMDIAEDFLLAMDRQDFLELLGNILDNAYKWATGKIRITGTYSPAPELQIEDDGPGCPTGDLDRLTQRGTRLDEATSGHGLGLGIVADIMEDYSGEMAFTPSPVLGGLCVNLKFSKPLSTASIK